MCDVRKLGDDLRDFLKSVHFLIDRFYLRQHDFSHKTNSDAFCVELPNNRIVVQIIFGTSL